MSRRVLGTSSRTAGASAFTGLLGALLFTELFSGIIQTYFTPLPGLVSAKYGVSTGTLAWANIAVSLGLVIFTPVLTKLGTGAVTGPCSGWRSGWPPWAP